MMSRSDIYKILSEGHWVYSFDRFGHFLLLDQDNQEIGDYCNNRFIWIKPLTLSARIREKRTIFAMKVIYGITVEPDQISVFVMAGAVVLMSVIFMRNDYKKN